MKSANKTDNRTRRRNRIRSKVEGTLERPRLAVFKSNRYISAQLINDETGTTLAAATSKGAAGKMPKDRAEEVGRLVAEQAKVKKVSLVVFDRGGYLYTGSVKALAEGARKGGLTF